MLIWTECYRPFIMGGDVNQPVGIEIEVGEKLELGLGFFGYVVVNGNTGQTHVVESESGAFVGTSLKKVREDIATCDDIKVMKKQVDEAKERRKRILVLDEPEEFWNLFS